jgi:hypothetical protein
MDFKAIDTITGREVSAILGMFVNDRGDLILNIMLDGNDLRVPASDIVIEVI